MTDVLYRPPSADLAPPPLPPTEAELASQGQRFLNFVIDRIAILVIFGTLFAALALLGVIDPDALESRLADFAATSAGALAYYVATEGLFGRSLGKLVTGTRVVAERGGPPVLSQIVIRSLSRFVPFEPFSFLGLPPAVGWHDRWSRTRVVRTRGPRVSFPPG